MVAEDYRFFLHCHRLGFAQGPLLEIGSAAIEGQGGNICQQAHKLGISETFGVDLAPGPGVDSVVDFSVPCREFAWQFSRFNTAVLFNLLEHTFDPITITRNAARCLNPGGSMLFVVPSVWPLHDFPRDYCRLNPHWFEEFAARYDLTIMREAFCWLSGFGMVPVDRLSAGAQYELPSFLNLGKAHSKVRYWRSRAIHRIFNTFGRSHWYGHCAIGCAMRLEQTRTGSDL